MARVARGKMSDRREDLTTAQVKCYIYNNKNATPPIIDIPPVTNTGTIPNVITTGTTTPTTPTTPVVTPPTTPTQPVVVPPTTPTEPVVVPQGFINKNLSLKLEDLSDMAEHFLTQNDFTITLVSKSPLRFGEAATVTLEIKDKN